MSRNDRFLPVASTPAGGRQLSAFLAGLLPLLLLLASCSSTPGLPEPSGRRFDVWMHDAKSLEVEGKTIPVEEFVEAMRLQAAKAKRGEAQAPYVVINLRPIKAPGFLDRLLDDLRRAGVRSVEIKG